MMKTSSKEIRMWTGLIYNPENKFVKDISAGWARHKKVFIDNIAEFIYNEIRQSRNLFRSFYTFKKDFGKLSDEEKSDWYDFAFEIPLKLKSLNLFIRPFNDFCRTCLIPYSEIEMLARADHERLLVKHTSTGNVSAAWKEVDEQQVSFIDLPNEMKRFYIELNHLIPVALKKAGYEIIRSSEIGEISDKMVIRLAKAIHSRYLQEIKKQNEGNIKKIYTYLINNPDDRTFSDFDDLPEEIRHSNLDNAFHIPTKLLSIGYKIRPVGKGFKPAALHLSDKEVETMARIEHLRWCWDKILHGWHYGRVKDAKKKTHPGIVAYEDLKDSEQDKDRELVKLIPSLLQDIGYEAFYINPGRISKLPYALKPMSSVHKILDETKRMNDQIRQMITIPPDVDKILQIRNKKIEDAISEVESSYNYAQHIQETFLPDNLYVRYCFPESFILCLPKDIVSGDFYFFSRKDKQTVFAVADCTGHGIPGAIMSTIGYSILDQAVNEIKLRDPAQILHHLYSRIHKFLRFEPDGSGLSDDMDIMLCLLDTGTNVLTYSGVKSPLYHFREGTLSEYNGTSLPDDCREEGECPFSSKTIVLKSGDIIYLCSDGYTDQFGGENHKRYSGSRFRSFLQKIEEYPMAEQGDRLYEEFELWRESKNEDQTDDILVIGIRV